jgi:uncharacterized protein YdhG (YjbR/CyaY superfamily)
MKSDETAPKTVDEYIAAFPNEVQDLLEKIRATIRQTAPDAQETISYQMPTFVLHGALVHFAAFKNHIGFYPTPNGIEEFEDALSGYASGKGSAKFPLDEPIPFDLIRKIVRFRVEQNLAKAAAKKKR